MTLVRPATAIVGLIFVMGVRSLAADSLTPVQFDLLEQSKPISVTSAEVFEDQDRNVDWATLQRLERQDKVPWKRTNQFNYGYSRSRYWFKFSVKNIETNNTKWILELAYPLIQKVGVHFLQSNGVATAFDTGRFVPFRDRPIEFRTFLFPFHVESGATATIYAFIESGGTLRAPFRLYSENSLMPATEQQSLGLGLYYGVILSMVIYNLFVYLALRDKTYLYYVLYASSFAILQSALTGHAYQFLWPHLVFWNRISVPFLVGFSFLFLAVFTRSLLDTKKASPMSNNLLTLLASLAVLLMVLSLGDYGIRPNEFASMMVSYAPFLVIPAVLVCIRRGSRPAIYYAVAFFSFFIGSAAVASKDLGLLPLNFVTLHGMQLGSAVEALLFSLALAYRVRLLREEKLELALQGAVARQQLTESKLQLNSERVLSSFAQQVAHDIRSPLAALEMITNVSSKVPESERVILRQAATRIRDIANDLSGRFREKQDNVGSFIEPQLIPSLIDEIVTEKRLRYSTKTGLEITANMDGRNYGLFAKANPSNFRRALSNVIQNAIEAIPNEGKVEIRSGANAGLARIEIIDNGQGIPPEVLPRLGRRGQTFGKADGSGLGLHYAKQMVESWGGSIEIESEVTKGTVVRFLLPIAPAPEWFVRKLEIYAGSHVVVLDDEQSIHQIWNERFLEWTTTGAIKLLHFFSAKALRAWFGTNKDVALASTYLLDFELIGEEDNGLSVIQELAIQERAFLVSSRYEESEVKAACKRNCIRLIPKGLAAFVPIGIESSRSMVF